MSPTPFNGRLAAVAEAVGCLVTLGTPHQLHTLDNRYQHAGHQAAAFLERETPGTWFAPRTAYLTVGATYAGGAFPGLVGRAFDEVFSVIVGRDTATAVGDGIVPAESVHLAGAEQLTFDDVRHGFIGRSWYGADEIVDRWWPPAAELWRGALKARAKADRRAQSAKSVTEPALASG
jgi:hypothetical protein